MNTRIPVSFSHEAIRNNQRDAWVRNYMERQKDGLTEWFEYCDDKVKDDLLTVTWEILCGYPVTDDQRLLALLKLAGKFSDALTDAANDAEEFLGGR